MVRISLSLALVVLCAFPVRAGGSRYLLDNLYTCKFRLQEIKWKLPYATGISFDMDGMTVNFGDEVKDLWENDAPDTQALKKQLEVFVDEQLKFVNEQINREIAK